MKSVLLVVLALLCGACTTPGPSYGLDRNALRPATGAEAGLASLADAGLANMFADAGVPPKVVRAVAPGMSHDAVKHGRMGTVTAEIFVGPDGRVTEVKILESPNAYLSQDVVRAFRQWEFRPLMVRGQPQPFNFRVPVTFGLDR